MKRLVALLVLLALSSLSFATTFHALLSSEPGAPSPEVVVQEIATSPPPPVSVLAAFNEQAPEAVSYLINRRATGNLRTLMDNSPDWAATKLHQYIVVTYDEAISSADIVASYNNDPYVVVAYEVDEDDVPVLHARATSARTVELASTAEFTRASFELNRDSLNFDDIWDLSEGMGYVGVIDQGIQIDHPDLRAFDAGGNYTGGNLLDSFYQIDIAESTPSSTNFNVDDLEPVPGSPNCDALDGIPNDGLTIASFAGHGTHVGGAIGAKGTTAPGICRNCGLANAKIFSALLGSCVFNSIQFKIDGFSHLCPHSLL